MSAFVGTGCNDEDSSSGSLTRLRVDGGMTANKYFVQKLADVLHVDIGTSSRCFVE